MNQATAARALSLRLIESTPAEQRCPYLAKDTFGPYCSKDLAPGSVPSGQRRNICDHLSLQLWCLDKDRCHKCIWYQGEPFLQ